MSGRGGGGSGGNKPKIFGGWSMAMKNRNVGGGNVFASGGGVSKTAPAHMPVMQPFRYGGFLDV